MKIFTQRLVRNLELAFRRQLREMRGKKSRKKFAEELGMKESNYLKIELGKSNPTIKTLERMANLTNSTLVIELVPNESPQVGGEQLTLDLKETEDEEDKQ